MKIFITMLTALLSSSLIFCQHQQAVPLEKAKIIFNGAYIVITHNADLVVQNNSPIALSVKKGGGIISESANNNVIWNIANDTAYSVPFVAADLTAIPVSFNAAHGSGSGSFTFSTYSRTPDWQNSDYLPSVVTNVNRNGKDNSKHLIDRFWKIAPAGYTANPHLKNLIFSYRDLEWNEDSNAITEKNLAAQNWNGTKWTDAVGIDKPALSYVKINSANNFFSWWTLVDSDFVLKGNEGFALQNNLLFSDINNQQSITLIMLNQNFPNPFINETTISYYLPKQYSSAKIIVTDNSGRILKEADITFAGRGSININASTFTSGLYQYSLIIDGKIIETKQMEHLK